MNCTAPFSIIMYEASNYAQTDVTCIKSRDSKTHTQKAEPGFKENVFFHNFCSFKSYKCMQVNGIQSETI